ncbi:MAG: alpha/beta hydrolase [Saprospiraceae bacterium]|nr:alpha/beta hydrolase [Saprospiraceae bacterium]
MKYILLVFSLLISVSINAQKRLIKVDSSKVWVNTIGIENRKEGQPVVVFESGYGTPMDNWDKVLEGVSKLAPLVTYDRPGIGKSEPIDEMPTIRNVSDRLVRILNLLELEPPYILVGHSLGGLYVRGFANYYPELLAGLVIIDPADFTETYQNKRLYYDVLNWEDAKIDSLIQSFIEKRKIGKEQVPLSMQREGQVLEDLRENEFVEITKDSLPNIPVHILTGGRFDKPEKFRSKEYNEEALFRSKMKHRVHRWINVIQSVDKGMMLYSGDAGHFVHIDDPELLISSIRIVLKDYKSIRQINDE